MTSEQEQIDSDLQAHLISKCRKAILDYHTAADIASIPVNAQLATVTSSIAYLFLRLIVEAKVEKKFMLETLTDTYDMLKERYSK